MEKIHILEMPSVYTALSSGLACLSPGPTVIHPNTANQIRSIKSLKFLRVLSLGVKDKDKS